MFIRLMLFIALVGVENASAITSTYTATSQLSTFPSWDSTWQLPAVGQGVVTFTVTPASGESLHDIGFALSSVVGIAGEGDNGGVDSDNFATVAAGWVNTESIVVNGSASTANYYFWLNGFNTLQGSSSLGSSTKPVLANAGTDVAYDFSISIDKPNGLFTVAARQSGIGDYRVLYTYAEALFSIPANVQYFSFSSFDSVLNYSNIAVTTLPAITSRYSAYAQFSTFSSWDSTWQLPAVGQGVVTFTVTPASGQSLHDIGFALSSVAGIAGQGGNGGVDSDNFATVVAGWGNTESILTRGKVSSKAYYFWLDNNNTKQGGPHFVSSLNHILASASSNISYDFSISIDASNNMLTVSARQSGVGDYQVLYIYAGANFSIPTNARYFSFSSFDTILYYSDVAVAPLPLVDPATVPPVSLTTYAFPVNGDIWFPVWNAEWQLPVVGQGVVSFTVTPTAGATLQDVAVGFSPTKGIAGLTSGGVDSDNLWTIIAGWSGTESAITVGYQSSGSCYYWFNDTYQNTYGINFLTSLGFTPTTVPFLEWGSAGVAYDFQVTLDAPQGIFKVAGRVSGVGDYQLLYSYRGGLPANSQYFSFGNYARRLTYSNIVATALPTPSIVLDGRNQIVTLDSHYTFTNGEWAIGFVHFNKGFTVPAGTVAYLDIFPPVQGPINLNGTGTLILNGPLELGVLHGGFPQGGIITTSDGGQGQLSFQNDLLLTNTLVFQSSMAINGATHRLILSSTGTNRGVVMIDNSISQTLYLRNMTVQGIEDFNTGYGPKFRASSTAGGRHGFAFHRSTMLFTEDGTATFTNADFIVQSGSNKVNCQMSSVLRLNAGLYINDLATLSVGDGMSLWLNTTLSNSYFSIGNGSNLALSNATLAYNKPIAFPMPIRAKNTTSALIVEGACTLSAQGVGDDTVCTLGVDAPDSVYTYDPVIDIYPEAQITLNNVQLIDYTGVR